MTLLYDPIFHYEENSWDITTQNMKFSIKDFFNKCDQICNFLRIWSHLMKKSLIENFIFVQCVLDISVHEEFCSERALHSYRTFLCSFNDVKDAQ